MLRHYYVSDDLDELEVVENDLEKNGFTKPQIHVLSENDAEVDIHHLHKVSSVLKQDVIHSTQMGALIGALAAMLLLLLVYILAWHTSPAGWLPFIFLAIIILGFCTWEGGFIGIQKPNVNFERFQNLLHKGKSVLFVDVYPSQEVALANVMKSHPKIEMSGFGESTPEWLVKAQNLIASYIKR